MEFRTIVDITTPPFRIEPEDDLLFLGSCFADSIGRRFRANRLRAVVNPRGTMYNPASILHTLQLMPDLRPRVAFLTLGTNHVYRLRETGEIVDNCEKRPARLFQEEQLSVDECADYLRQCVALLRQRRSDVQVVLTVSPIRYRKYGYHESQLSKATLLLAVRDLVDSLQCIVNSYDYTDGRNAIEESSEKGNHNYKLSTINYQLSTINYKLSTINYFPAYELVLDELRDYRFYQPDMLHPSEQAVDFIYERLAEHYFSERLNDYLREWLPIRATLEHRPFNPDSTAYKELMAKTQAKLDALRAKYPALDLNI